MSKSLFASSKSALVFAGITIAGALMMVGPGEGGGLLDKTVDRFAQERTNIAEEARVVSEQHTEVIEPIDPAAGWGGTGSAVFGEYNPEETATTEEAGQNPSPVSPFAATSRPKQAPQGPIGGPVRADSPGISVPRGSAAVAERPLPEPVVTSRSLKIEPQ
jgi:hypothetical protein